MAENSRVHQSLFILFACTQVLLLEKLQSCHWLNATACLPSALERGSQFGVNSHEMIIALYGDRLVSVCSING